MALSPLASGWSLSAREGPTGKRRLYFRRASEELRFLLDLKALALGILPLLALIGATPRLGWRDRARAAVLGIVGLFLLDLTVVLLYPFLVRAPNAFKDILGEFLGMLTFVGGPVILWFALTYRQLGRTWGLGQGRSTAD